MSRENDNGTFASPPCLMHELDPAYAGLPAKDRTRQGADVARWRKAERQRLIAKRLATTPQSRKEDAAVITDHVAERIGRIEGKIVSAYWPFRGEPDLRGLLGRIAASGGRTALPVVTEKGKPLMFRIWAPGDPLESGVWNIPIPGKTSREVVPDIVIAPVVGFDSRCYRLGYGGGFFDRTLAAMGTKRLVIGVGFENAAIPTIYPQPYDIPMDIIITEARVLSRRDGLPREQAHTHD